MGIFKRNENKETGKLPMGRKSRKAFAVYAAAVLCMTCFTTTAFAASDPLTVVNNLSDFIFGLIRAIGMILLGFGIVWSDPCDWYDFARLWYRADWSELKIPRPVPEGEWFSDPCGRRHHHFR